MPVVACQKGGRPGFKWGSRGFCYTYTPGNKAGRKRARAKAAAQGRAIEAARRRRNDAIPRIVPPRGIERDYRAMQIRRLRRLHKMVTDALRTTLRRLPGINERARGDGRVDAEAEDIAALIARIEAIRRAWRVQLIESDEVLGVAEQVNRFTTRRTVTAVEQVVPIDVVEVLAAADETDATQRAWARRNAELITSVEERHLDDVAAAVTEAVEKGRSTRDLARDIEERFGISQRRAALVARDQVGTLNSQITQERQTDLGIDRYRWSTAGDGRVRDAHRAIDGDVFTWASGHPTEGHPGEPINCRCVAIPVV
jgi:SPP1 gp7 family putative phage head morphogenesis protein